MMTVTIDPRQIAAMKAAIEGTGRSLRKELAIAVRATAKKSKSIINKNIRTELANVTARDINFTIKVNISPGTENLTASVDVKKVDRLSLRNFKPRQTRAGVSYRISKSSGRKTVPGAFISAKLHGGVFKRFGKARLPIVKLMGLSPWGAFVVGKKSGPSVKETEAELKKNIDRRIRFINLKASGAI